MDRRPGAFAHKLFAVGAVCSCFNVILVGIAERIGFHYLTGALLAFPAVLVVGYSLHARFTFSEPPSLASFVAYAAAMGLNLPVAALLLVAFCELLGLSASMGMLSATLVLAAWNLLSPVLAFRIGRMSRVGRSGAAG